jgi:hypothetical protein
MQDQPEDGVFDMRLSPEGLSQLKNNSRQIRVLLVLVIVGTAILILITLLSAVRMNNFYVSRHGLSSWYYARLQPAMILLDIVLIILQIQAYWRFGQDSERAIGEGDEARLNSSFAFLVRANKVSMVHLCMVILMYSISVLVLIASFP